MDTTRPGFHHHITSSLKHDEGVKAYGFWFYEPGSDVESERYAMLIRTGMSPLDVASALEKIADQMRNRTGANGTERLEGREVNAADFPPGVERKEGE